MISPHRVRPTTPADPPSRDAPEGTKAAWWREHKMKMSRPQLAKEVGFSVQQIGRYEKMAEVPLHYNMACGSMQVRILGWATYPNHRFEWNPF